MKLQAFNSSYFHGKIFFGYDGSQNIFVYHPKINMLELKKTRALITLLGGNQRNYMLLKLIHSRLISSIV